MGVQKRVQMIAGLILLSLAINVLFERRRVEHRVAFAALLSSFALFNLSWFFFSVTTSGFWRSLLLISAITIAHTCLSFFERVLQTSLRTWRTLASVVSGLILVLIPTDVAREPSYWHLRAVLRSASTRSVFLGSTNDTDVLKTESSQLALAT